MEAQGIQDSLDVLQGAFNESLIQTGKALRASRQDGSVLTPLKLPDTLTSYHNALDKIDREIVRAKAILTRDLERLQNKDANIPMPQPVEAQTKTPMVVDLDSSPIQPKAEPPETNGVEQNKPVAPFPDMGMDIPAAAAPMKADDSAPQAPMPDMGEIQPTANMAPEETKQETKPETGAANEVKIDAPAENFTNMQFTLAPVDNEAPNPLVGQDQPFDMSSFTNDAGNGTVDLSDLLPPSTQQGSANPLASINVDAGTQGQTDGAANGTNEAAIDHTFDLDNMDWDGADGSDFNFDINDDGTFNDQMQSHDYMNDMEHGQSDADYFGISNNNE